MPRRVKQRGSKPSGCWTCRLRRKKCDGGRPACESCRALGITCHAGPKKPEWMDGGSKQSNMALVIKNQVKQGSIDRRKRRGTQVRGFIVTSEQDYRPPTSTEDSASAPETDDSQRQQSTTGNGRLSGLSAPVLVSKRTRHIQSAFPSANTIPTRRRYPDPSAEEIVARSSQGYRPAPGLLTGLAQEFDLELVMMYLDYDFPFLFPFYRAPMENRSWLLPFLSNNKAVLHSVQSLSSYFFTVALNDVFPDAQKQCKESVWLQVVEQADLCFERIQKDLRDITHRGPHADVTDKARVMESIIQLLIFEMFIQKSGNWEMHLTPAMTLFEEILERHHQGPAGSNDMLSVLQEMEPQAIESSSGLKHGWNSDQGAFRFFTAILLFIDVIASTSLQQPPRLQEYHHIILEQSESADSTATLDMSSFVGCQNWVIRTLGEIAALDSWKHQMKRSGSLSVPDLVRRAEKISQALHRGLEGLNTTQPISSLRSINITRLQPYYDINLSKSDAGLSVMPTRIWAHASLIYLSVVVSGWQPSNTQIRQNVEQVLSLLKHIKCSAQIRTFAWPICVAGCLSEPGQQEQDFHTIIEGAGDLLRVPGNVMEAVWRKRGTLNDEMWDLASCLCILGKPALLI